VAYTVILNVHKGIVSLVNGVQDNPSETVDVVDESYLYSPKALDLFTKMSKDLSRQYLKVVLQFLGRFV
jgi:hypothetical protein